MLAAVDSLTPIVWLLAGATSAPLSPKMWPQDLVPSFPYGGTGSCPMTSLEIEIVVLAERFIQRSALLVLTLLPGRPKWPLLRWSRNDCACYPDLPVWRFAATWLQYLLLRIDCKSMVISQAMPSLSRSSFVLVGWVGALNVKDTGFKGSVQFSNFLP